MDPAVQRYKETYSEPNQPGEVYTDEGEAFKSNLRSFIRLYSFLSQVVDFVDPDLHKLFAYGGLLLTKLPDRSSDGPMDVDNELTLESYRLEKTFEGRGTLGKGDTEPVIGPTEIGTGGGHEPEQSPLSKIIDIVNEKYGTDWTEADKLLFEQISDDMVNNDALAEKMRANTKEQVKPVFESEAMTAFVNRHGRIEKIVGDFMQDANLRRLIIAALLDDVYFKTTNEKMR